MTGLFSDEVMSKLTDVAETMFGWRDTTHGNSAVLQQKSSAEKSLMHKSRKRHNLHLYDPEQDRARIYVCMSSTAVDRRTKVRGNPSVHGSISSAQVSIPIGLHLGTRCREFVLSEVV
jgi:hypothetical protein